jgi:protein-disulfide isomerase
MRTASTIALALLLGAVLSSCRNPSKNNPWTPPDGGDFDAAPDDAGPGELCPSDAPDLFNNAYSPYLGGEQAVDLEVVGFSFFRCPHCADFAEWARAEWATNDEYRERVRIFFHHFPFSSQVYWEIHAATVAAANQGMDNFWAMHDYLFEGVNQDVTYEPDQLRTFADEVLGLDMQLYDYDVTSEMTYGFLEWDRSQLEALGYSSTPSIFICGEKVSSWIATGDAIDSHLEL